MSAIFNAIDRTDDMLHDSQAFSGFSTDDIDKAKQFYGETLGLEVTDPGMGIIGLSFANGGSGVIYPKPNHQPAGFTVLNFPVDDVEAAVEELAAKGVEFEHYEGMSTEPSGVMKGRGPTIAWFKDPAGNILSLIEPDSANE